MNLISAKNFTRDSVMSILHKSDGFLNTANKSMATELHDKVAGLLFFESSTRTRIGYEVAAYKLGMNTISMDTFKPSKSTGWSETMSDTIRTLNSYVDAFFVRHPSENIFNDIIPYAHVPVINCGNGYDEHPTQALIDSYAIWKRFDRLDNLSVTFIGDVRYSRCARSLMILLSNFEGIVINIIAPEQLIPDKRLLRMLDKKVRVNVITKDDLGHEDILYSSGFAPTNPSGTFTHETVIDYSITLEDVAKLKDTCIIMNPLPRIDEISHDVDYSDKAYYFEQNRMGLYVRMAILEMLCG